MVRLLVHYPIYFDQIAQSVFRNGTPNHNIPTSMLDCRRNAFINKPFAFSSPNKHPSISSKTFELWFVSPYSISPWSNFYILLQISRVLFCFVVSVKASFGYSANQFLISQIYSCLMQKCWYPWVMPNWFEHKVVWRISYDLWDLTVWVLGYPFSKFSFASTSREICTRFCGFHFVYCVVCVFKEHLSSEAIFFSFSIIRSVFYPCSLLYSQISTLTHSPSEKTNKLPRLICCLNYFYLYSTRND